jgi:hypothetical protein
MSRVRCIPTVISDLSNQIDDDNNIFNRGNVKELLGHLFSATSAPTRTNNLSENLDQSRFPRKGIPTDVVVTQVCSCHSSQETEISTQDLKVNAKSEAIIELPFNNCNNSRFQSNTTIFQSQDRNLPEFFVCLLDSSALSVPRRASKLIKIHSLSKIIKVRNGKYSVDSILPFDSFEELHSDFIRIEFPVKSLQPSSNDVNRLLIFMSFDSRNQSKGGHSFLRTFDDSKSLHETLYYSLAWGSIIAFVACFIAVCICLNLDRRKVRQIKKKNKDIRKLDRKASVSSPSDDEDFQGSNEVTVRATSIMSHFDEDRGSGPSLEMDFYDLNGGNDNRITESRRSKSQADTSFDH